MIKFDFDRIEETTEVEGTGTATLLGATTGMRAFSNIRADGDVVLVCIDDGAGNWEVSYSHLVLAGSDWTVDRYDVVLASTGGANVDFAVGTKKVFWPIVSSEMARLFPPVLSAGWEFFISPTGDDANPGTSASPFLNIFKALEIIRRSHVVGPGTIWLQDGTYIQTFLSPLAATMESSDISSLSLNAIVTIKGVNTTGAIVQGFSAINCAKGEYFLKNLKLDTGWIPGLDVINSAVSMDNIEFAGGMWRHVNAVRSMIAESNSTISGGAGSHWYAGPGSHINASGTFTVTGTPAFTDQFAVADDGLIECGSVAFSAGATGTRYLAKRNGIVDTGGAGASFLPGTVAGSTSSQGQYL